MALYFSQLTLGSSVLRASELSQCVITIYMARFTSTNTIESAVLSFTLPKYYGHMHSLSDRISMPPHLYILSVSYWITQDAC